MDPDEALRCLLEGNDRFAANAGGHHNLKAEREQSCQGQHPFATIVACSDSREPPEHIFDQGIGHVFVLRSAGNVVFGPALEASMEYAVLHLRTPLVLVLAHEDCGAVKAALEMAKGKRFEREVEDLLAHILHNIGFNGSLPEDLSECAKKNALGVAERIRELNPKIAELEEQGRLKILAAFHHLSSGKVEVL